MHEPSTLPHDAARQTRARLAIVGMGALGTEVCHKLANNPALRSPFRSVLLVDPDRVEPGNVAISHLFHAAFTEQQEKLFGQFKVDVVANLLQADPVCTWKAEPSEIADVSWHKLRDVDLLVCCTDNALARVETCFVALSLGLPMLDGGVLGEAAAGGRVTWFSPAPEAACYLCGLGQQRRAELLAYATAGSLSCRLPTENAAMGDVPLVSASLRHTATVLVEVLHQFLATTRNALSVEPFSRSSATCLESQQQGTWNTVPVALNRSLTCPWHEAMQLPLVSVEPDQTFAEALGPGPYGTPYRLQFAWPICTLFACRVCGGKGIQPRRLAWVRRHGVCPHCKTSHQLAPLRSIASVGHNDSVAKMTPRQLGWGDRQLLQLRPALAPATRETEGR